MCPHLWLLLWSSPLSLQALHQCRWAGVHWPLVAHVGTCHSFQMIIQQVIFPWIGKENLSPLSFPVLLQILLYLQGWNGERESGMTACYCFYQLEESGTQQTFRSITMLYKYYWSILLHGPFLSFLRLLAKGADCSRCQSVGICIYLSPLVGQFHPNWQRQCLQLSQLPSL